MSLDNLHQSDVPSPRPLKWLARELDGAVHRMNGAKMLLVGTDV